MRSLANILRYRPVRQSTAVSLEGSAAVPDSGNASVDNAQGASRNLADFSRELDGAFEIGGKGDLAVRLAAAGEKYSNNKLNFETRSDREWGCPPFESDLILIAAKSAKAVYNEQIEPSLQDYKFSRIFNISPSITGTTKATAIFMIEGASSRSASNPNLPLLVVAVKGTKLSRGVDWLVNLNTELRVVHDGIKAHAGYINGADALEAAIRSQIDSTCRGSKTWNVLFTGHSAGGAVASLLFTRFLLSTLKYLNIRFSCVTFGSPPVVTRDISHILQSIRQGSPRPYNYCNTVLAFVNEGDLVPRADKDYVSSLKHLLDVHRIGPGEKAPTAVAESPLPIWSLPPPSLSMIGDIVILKKDRSAEQSLTYRSYLVSPQKFSSLLFCNKDAHHMDVYVGNLIELQKRAHAQQ